MWITSICQKGAEAEADLGLLKHPKWSTLLTIWSTVNYYHKALHLGCCSSPRSTSAEISLDQNCRNSF